MYCPRFTEVIIHHFLTKDKRISKRNKIGMHTSRDDYLINTLRFVSVKEESQIYGARLPKSMTSPDMRETKACKTYLGYDIGVTPPKKAWKFKKPTSPKLSTVSASLKEPTRKSKRVKSSANKSFDAPTAGVLIRETPVKCLSKKKEKMTVEKHKGIDLLPKVALTEEAHAAKIKPSVTNEGTGVKPAVPDVTEEESTKSEAKSWGKYKDDSNNKHDSRSEGSNQERDSGDDNTQSDSEKWSNCKHETDENKLGSESDQEENEEEIEMMKKKRRMNEGDEDEGMDYTTNQFDDDVDLRMNEPVTIDEEFIQKEGTNAEMTNVQQGNENLKITLNQVIEDVHVTISTVPQKTKVPVTSSSHSSDLASKFLNFLDIPYKDAKNVSLMDVHVHHEVSSKQTPILLTKLGSTNGIRACKEDLNKKKLLLHTRSVYYKEMDEDSVHMMATSKMHMLKPSLKELFTEMSDDDATGAESPPRGVDSYYRPGNFKDPSLIVYPAAANGAMRNFKIQPNLIVILPLFRGHEEPYVHLREFFSIADTYQVNNTTKDRGAPSNEEVNEVYGNHPRNDPFFESYNPGWCNHPNFRWKDDDNYNRPTNTKQQNHGYIPSELAKSNQGANLKFESLSKSVANLERQMGQLAEEVHTREAGKIPSYPDLNTKHKPGGPEHVNMNPEATESPKAREGGVSSITTPYPAALEKPASARLAKKGPHSEDMWETFKQVKINIPLIDAIKQIPAYAKFLKHLCTQKRKLKATLPNKIDLTEHVSTVLSSSLPPKFKHPGAPLILFVVENITIERMLLDLGASINILPASLVDKYELETLRKTDTIISLADRSTKNPRGILEDVIVKVDDFYYPVDFFVMNIVPYKDVQPNIILGRPFLATIDARINCRTGVMDIDFGNKKLRLNVFNSLNSPISNDCYHIDTIDECIQTYTPSMNLDRTLENLHYVDIENELFDGMMFHEKEEDDAYHNSPLITKVVEGVTTTIAPSIAEEKAQRRMLRRGLEENAATKKTQRNLLKQQYENFTASSSEVTNGAVNNALGVSNASSQVNTVNSSNINNLSNVIICAFLVSKPGSPQLVNEDLEQIHPDDLEEIDLKWQIAMLIMRARRFLKKTGRKLTINGNDTIGFYKSNVKCYNCHKREHFTRECRTLSHHDNKQNKSTRRNVPVEILALTALVTYNGLGGYDWSDQVEEGPTNLARMAYSSTSLNSEVSTDSNCSSSYMENVKILKEQNEQLLKDLRTYKINAITYKTGNFMPPKPNFSGLEEIVNEPIVSEPTLKKPVVETSEAKASADRPKIVRKNNDALLIKD
uniref:CCHC-type domain-containing protein n=1 Tax=Tanacetum cinerariifolium TaxID=118510 RepID=A0A6L2L203_TANCI|nr:hypothetical protein [Tanacetum cinerariifolium]